MAIEHNGKIIRSLPEQVGKNLTDIIKLTSDIVSLTALVQSKLTGAMHYKGSVATVADLPATGNEVGDFYNVTSTGANYAWDGTQWDDIGSVVDLTPYARKDQNNTFSANNEFTGDVKVDTVLDIEDNTVFGITDIDNKIAQTSYTIIPTTIAGQNLGSSTYYYKTVYATEISNGVTTFSINDFQSMDQDISDIMRDYITSQDLANYATKDEAFSIIKVSDMTDATHLAQAQIDILLQNKPTIFQGTWLYEVNAILYPRGVKNNVLYGWVMCGGNEHLDFQAFTVNLTTKVLSYSSGSARYRIDNGNTLIIDGTSIRVKNKNIPGYPSDTTKQYKLVQQIGGNLAWVEDV